MSDPGLLTNYGSNLLAMVTFAVFAGAAWVCKHKCRHQRWAVDSGCLKCSGDDVVTHHEKPEGMSEV